MKPPKVKVKVKRECCIEGEELISKLPDEILVRVLSLLAPSEVIRCGALCRRWTTLPKLVPMTLNFFRKYEIPSLAEERKFIDHVNQVIDSYPAETLAALSISYYLSIPDQPRDICSQFDNWVQFAMAKKVSKFDLNLSNFIGMVSHNKYQFPPLPMDQNRSRSQVGLSMCTSLTHLRLHSVNVTDEHIAHFLKCCPFLESLCVIGSDILTSLKVYDPIGLKFLEILHCPNLQIFEISAPDLISFKYSQHRTMRQVTSMPLKYAPQLNELWVSGGFYNFVTDNFHLFTSYFARIEILSLGVVRPLNSQEFHWPIGIPTLRNLKHLIVRAMIYDTNSLLCFFGPWIEASPLLRRFVFKRSGIPCGPRRQAVEPQTCQHQFLKEVEFVGFIGDILDTELVMYVIKNAVNLGKIIFDCREPRFIGTSMGDTTSKNSSFDKACARARKFKSKLSSAVDFVLIP